AQCETPRRFRSRTPLQYRDPRRFRSKGESERSPFAATRVEAAAANLAGKPCRAAYLKTITSERPALQPPGAKADQQPPHSPTPNYDCARPLRPSNVLAEGV